MIITLRLHCLCLQRTHAQPRAAILGGAPKHRAVASGRQSCCLKPLLVAARPNDEVEPVPPAVLSRFGSEDELLEESAWIASMITCWLDEEWPATELAEAHASLGTAAGQAYFRLRQELGIEEMGDLVSLLARELLSFDYHPTFTDAFSVGNKVVELLMLRDGCDVCCTSESDRTAIARYEAQLAGAAKGQL